MHLEVVPERHMHRRHTAQPRQRVGIHALLLRSAGVAPVRSRSCSGRVPSFGRGSCAALASASPPPSLPSRYSFAPHCPQGFIFRSRISSGTSVVKFTYVIRLSP